MVGKTAPDPTTPDTLVLNLTWDDDGLLLSMAYLKNSAAFQELHLPLRQQRKSCCNGRGGLEERHDQLAVRL